MLIWLPQQGFQQPEAACKNVAYIPERVFSDPLIAIDVARLWYFNRIHW